uniref:Uncharacterized protein n=1 Tax=Trichuris muris TaxID=70415 RepID=A0A5S6QWZ0_TRIMR
MVTDCGPADKKCTNLPINFCVHYRKIYKLSIIIHCGSLWRNGSWKSSVSALREGRIIINILTRLRLATGTVELE